MGKGKHSNDTRGDQKGAQQHDEGQYGPKALEAKRAEIADHSGSRGQSERAIADPNRDGKSGEGLTALHEQEKNDPSMRDGRHRLFEERKQHDIADRNQDKNRLQDDVEKHGHNRDEYQVIGGRAKHPEGAEDRKGPTLHSPGESGK